MKYVFVVNEISFVETLGNNVKQFDIIFYYLSYRSASSWVKSPKRFLNVPGFRMRQRVNSDATTNRTLSPLKSTLTLSQRRKSSDAASEESVKSKVSIQFRSG